MKYVAYAFLLVSLIIVFSACTIHFPYDYWDWDHSEYRVILKIEPDDAQVLLNGKWIGEAYEFSSNNSALRLSTRNNELVLKKEGYIEEVIDLYEYNTRKIIINLILREDKDYSGPINSKTPGKKVTPKDAERKPEYTPKTEPPKEIPPEPQEESKETVTTTEVVLEIQPQEASIYLDGRFWGIVPMNGKIENLRLKPGKYTLEISKPGYQDYKKEIEVTTEKPKIHIKIKLEKNKT
jgi:hypothetical protein